MQMMIPRQLHTFTRAQCQGLKQKQATALAMHFRDVFGIDVEGTHGKQMSRAKRTLPMVREDLERKWPEDRASVTVLVPR